MADPAQTTVPAIMSVERVMIQCYKCGIPFIVPREYEQRRREDGRSFWCPNGHGQVFRTLDNKKPTLEQRQELVAALHRAEQAEAKAAEAQAKLANAQPPATVPLRPDTAAVADAATVTPAGPVEVTIRLDKHGYAICPKCGQTFHQVGGHLARHLRRKHGVEVKGWRVEAGKGADHV